MSYIKQAHSIREVGGDNAVVDWYASLSEDEQKIYHDEMTTMIDKWVAAIKILFDPLRDFLAQ